LWQSVVQFFVHGGGGHFSFSGLQTSPAMAIPLNPIKPTTLNAIVSGVGFRKYFIAWILRSVVIVVRPADRTKIAH
jgi:hypothetical protein